MNILFQTLVGSKLYNLDTKSSDTDYKGFGFPSNEALLGLKHEEQVEYKNEREKVEGTIYSLEKYFRLCLAGNPSILDVAFADKKFVLATTKVGEEVNDFIRKNVITKSLFNPYFGYFKAQVRELNESKKTGVRAVLVEKYGYDTKFASHAVRLALQFSEIMRTGWLKPTLTGLEQEMCFDIKSGKYKLEEVNSLFKVLEHTMINSYENAKLPEAPDKELWSATLTDFQMEYIKCQ